MEKKLIYFLCTGNSARSQMAEGLLRNLGESQYEVKSAGIEAHGLNPYAIQAMEEVGIDIRHHSSDKIDSQVLNQSDYVITLCGHADEHCPVISNQDVIKWHWGFEDPAKKTGTDEEIIQQFRQVRDAIRARIAQFLQDGK